MIRCPDNQINASFIDISRIKWLVFLLWSSFFRTTSTIASSEAPADYQPAHGRTDGIPERHQRQWIISPSLQTCAWNTEKHRRVYTSSNVLSQPRVACWHDFRHDSQKTECVFTCLSDMRSKKKKLRVYTASEAKGLIVKILLVQSVNPMWRGRSHQVVSLDHLHRSFDWGNQHQDLLTANRTYNSQSAVQCLT